MSQLFLCLLLSVSSAIAATSETVVMAKRAVTQEATTFRGRLNPGGLSPASARNTKPVRTKSTQNYSTDDLQRISYEANAVENPPPICSGRGDLNSISLTDWEAGLGTWTVGTESVANPETFDTEDWQVIGAQPTGRPGDAAFVANLNSGDCNTDDDETGLLYLQSDVIELPAEALVPRLAFFHWFDIEQGWDGGNLKISVDGGPFTLIPTTAIEYNTYEGRLKSVAESNTNPMASQPAYTGASDGLQGAWEEVRVDLSDEAQPGQSIRIRFDFGIDCDIGEVGWYVDDVQVYSCSEELPPSDCGNSILDEGESCDDGNRLNGDGCSNTCQVEDGWVCVDPEPGGEIRDGGFEAGTPNPYWTEASLNFGTPICDEASCELGTGTGPAEGNFWAWFGGSEAQEEASLSQPVVIPETATRLTFGLEASFCDSGADYLEVILGGVQKFLIDGSSPLCGEVGYTTQSIDISEFAGTGSQLLEFHAETFANNLDVSNFFVDNVTIPPKPSACRAVVFIDGFESD